MKQVIQIQPPEEFALEKDDFLDRLLDALDELSAIVKIEKLVQLLARMRARDLFKVLLRHRGFRVQSGGMDPIRSFA